MASISDLFNALNDIKGKLDQLHVDAVNNGVKLDNIDASTLAVKNEVSTMNANLSTRIEALISTMQIEVTLSHHLTKQNESIICILEKLCKMDCDLLNLTNDSLIELRSVNKSTQNLSDLMTIDLPESAQELKRHNEVKNSIEKCCPPEKPRPFCEYKPCDNPGPYKHKGKEPKSGGFSEIKIKSATGKKDIRKSK